MPTGKVRRTKYKMLTEKVRLAKCKIWSLTFRFSLFQWNLKNIFLEIRLGFNPLLCIEFIWEKVNKMNNFNEKFYKILINKESFYMKQYYSNFYGKENFLAIKELKDGIYCVLISDGKNEEIDYSEAIAYIETLEKAFSLNMIILSDKEYI